MADSSEVQKARAEYKEASAELRVANQAAQKARTKVVSAMEKLRKAILKK